MAENFSELIEDTNLQTEAHCKLSRTENKNKITYIIQSETAKHQRQGGS